MKTNKRNTDTKESVKDKERKRSILQQMQYIFVVNLGTLSITLVYDKPYFSSLNYHYYFLIMNIELIEHPIRKSNE